MRLGVGSNSPRTSASFSCVTSFSCVHYVHHTQMDAAMNRTLSVKHTVDRHGHPLACVDGLPGDDAELDAQQMRRLAATLDRIAEDCDQGAGIPYAKKVTYDVKVEQQNPFVVYRAEICGGYSTAQRLAELTLHLYNGARHGVRLDNLLSSADERHTRIAIEMLAWYAKHGENCIDFMHLARQLAEKAAA